MLTTLQSLQVKEAVPYSLPNLPAAQRTGDFSFPALQPLFWLGHRISLELLGFLVWKYFFGSVFSQLDGLFRGLTTGLETRPEEEVGGMAPEILASIPFCEKENVYLIQPFLSVITLTLSGKRLIETSYWWTFFLEAFCLPSTYKIFSTQESILILSSFKQ